MKKIFLLHLSLSLLFLVSCTKKITTQTKNFPQRIVSLSPAATEILFAIDANSQTVAVSQFTDFPEEATKLPVVGSFDGNALSIEAIYSYKPDFVYLTSGMHDFLIPQLQNDKIQYYISNATSIQDVLKEIEEVAEITGHRAEGQKVIQQIKNKIASAKQVTNNKSVYWEVWNSPFMSAGKESFINDIINSAGGQNIFNDISESYPIVSEETIILRQPDIILIPKSSGVSADDVKNRTGWEKIPAVLNDKIFIVDDNLFTRPGPRIGQVVLELNKILSK